MNWIAVSIATSTQAIDALCARLLDTGVKGFEIEDSESFREFLDTKQGNWDYIDDELMELLQVGASVKFYLPEDSQGREQLQAVKDLLESIKHAENATWYGSLELALSGVKEDDWANNWKQYFKPLTVGKRLLIKPTWEEVADPDGRRILEIDPASSFGTGQHHTTQLCLAMLEGVLQEGDRVLDLGCGSGILSIAACLLGASDATAVDIAENAVCTARENATQNHISENRYTTYCGDICSDVTLREAIGSGYAVICANIVADILITMAPLFSQFLAKGGTLLVSGIIEERAMEVVQALEQEGYHVQAIQSQGGWVAVSMG